MLSPTWPNRLTMQEDYWTTWGLPFLLLPHIRYVQNQLEYDVGKKLVYYISAWFLSDFNPPFKWWVRWFLSSTSPSWISKHVTVCLDLGHDRVCLLEKLLTRCVRITRSAGSKISALHTMTSWDSARAFDCFLGYGHGAGLQFQT